MTGIRICSFFCIVSIRTWVGHSGEGLRGLWVFGKSKTRSGQREERGMSARGERRPSPEEEAERGGRRAGGREVSGVVVNSGEVELEVEEEEEGVK